MTTDNLQKNWHRSQLVVREGAQHGAPHEGGGAHAGARDAVEQLGDVGGDEEGDGAGEEDEREDAAGADGPVGPVEQLVGEETEGGAEEAVRDGSLQNC